MVCSNLNFLDSPLSDWGPLENNKGALIVAGFFVRAEFDLSHLFGLVITVVDGRHNRHLLLLLNIAVGIGVP